MSQNNTIKKSDKKFIRLEKARIRSRFLDTKKQEEMISELYKRFLGGSVATEVKKEEPKKAEVKKAEKPKAVKKEKVKTK